MADWDSPMAGYEKGSLLEHTLQQAKVLYKDKGPDQGHNEKFSTFQIKGFA
jgi:hypothetical protein